MILHRELTKNREILSSLNAVYPDSVFKFLCRGAKRKEETDDFVLGGFSNKAGETPNKLSESVGVSGYLMF